MASKPSVRTWSNSRGEGRVLNVDLVDETVQDFCYGFTELYTTPPPTFPFTLLSFPLPLPPSLHLAFQGEIRACAFNEAADKLQSQLEMGQVRFPFYNVSRICTCTCIQVYYISRGRLKPANKKFSSVKNDYELNMTDDTEVELVGVVITSWFRL